MYTIRILNGVGVANPAFDIVTDHNGLFPILSLLDLNPSVYFKVFMSGAQVTPSLFGWGEFRGWVQKFDYE